MASTYVNDLRLTEMGTGDNSGTWGSVTNTNLALIGEAFGYGTEAITTNADTHSTTIADGSTDPGRAMYLRYTGTLDSTCTVSLLPNTVNKLWIIENATSGSQSLSIKQGSGSEVTIPNGHVKMVYANGGTTSAAVTDALVDLNLGGDLTVGDDINMASDSAKINFGLDATNPDITLQHVADEGLILKNNNTADSSDVRLLLRTGETDIEANDVLGRVQFQAPDESTGTDAITVAAEIAAVSEGDFSASSNATKLSFKTGASEAATEKMALSSAGSLSLMKDSQAIKFGEDSDVTLTHVHGTGLLLNSTMQLQFNDASQNITAPNATTLDINATDEVEINATNIDLNGSVDLNTVSAVHTYKAGQSFFQGVTAAGAYYETDARGFYTYYDADDYTRMLAYNESGGSPVWQSRSGGGTIRSEIESNGDFLSATNSYASTSDARLKEHITDSGSQWDDVKAMRVRKYSFIADKTSGPTQIGVIAQELEASGMNGLVKTKPYMNPPADGDGPDEPVLDSDGNATNYKTVKYSILHMKALKALQEAMERIEALEAKVASLGG